MTEGFAGYEKGVYLLCLADQVFGPVNWPLLTLQFRVLAGLRE